MTENFERQAELALLSFDQQIIAAAKILGYKSLPPSIEQFITDPYYLGGVCENLFPFWRDKLKEIYPTPIHNAHPLVVLRGGTGCITGDTKIKLLNGNSYSIKELYEKYPEGGFEVYSWDIKNKKFAAGNVSGVYFTGIKKILKLRFSIDDSDEILCIRSTYDHKFLSDGKYIEAKDLEIGTSIQSLYLKEGATEYYKGYLEYWNSDINRWRPVHRVISNREEGDGTVVHHKDFNKLNNTSTNLEVFSSDAEHRKFHANEYWSREGSKEIESERLSKRNSEGHILFDKLSIMYFIMYHEFEFDEHDESKFNEYRQILINKGYINYRSPKYHVASDYSLSIDDIIIRSKSINVNYIDSESIKENLLQLELHTIRMKSFNSEFHPKLRKDITIEQIISIAKEIKDYRPGAIADKLNCSRGCVSGRIHNHIGSIEDFARYLDLPYIRNHTLLSIEESGEDHVYDMTVDKYSNYGIEDQFGNLLFTHNTGKSTVARIMSMYLLCRLFHLKDPYWTFKIMPGKNLKFSFFSYTTGLANTDFIDVINEWVNLSPYFQEQRSLGKFGIIEMVADGPRGNSNIGSDVLFYNLSELNFIRSDRAFEKLSQATQRFDGRFGRFKDFFGHIILDSSSKGDDSIVDMFVNNNPYQNVLVVNSNQWIVRKHLNYFGRLGWFEVYKGDAVHGPFIISDKKPFTDKMDPDRIIKVPEEMRADFEFDIIKSLQDKAGISTNTSDRLFQDTSNLVACFDQPNYVGQDVVKFDFYNKTDKLIYKFDRAIREIPDDKIIFVRYDIGTVSDYTGLAIAYFDKWKIYDLNKNIKQPEIIIPLACGISRFDGSETPIYHLYEFILDLHERFEIGMFTADQYASKQIFQDLTRENVPNSLLSVDRTDSSYILTKTLANNGLLHISQNNLLKTELCDLRRIGNKIDHTPTGCFIGDTKIIFRRNSLIGSIRLDELSNISEVFEVLTYSEIDDNFSWSFIEEVNLTRYVDELIELNFDDGSTYFCTPEHLILTELGYIQARYLVNQNIICL